MMTVIAKGATSGGRSSASSRSSTSSSKSGSTKSAPKTKPGDAVKTKDGKTVKSSTAKPTNSKYKESAGVVGADGYSPRFQSGYSAPPGSVVYYPQHSMIDYLPWVYLLSQQSPATDQAMVVQPDGKQVVAEPERGVDGMAIFNWILLVLIIVAVIAGVVWGVNKLTTRSNAYA